QVHRIQFGVHHDRIQSGMPEQRLDHMDRGIVVQMLRSKHAAAIMWMQFQRRPVGGPRSSCQGELAQASTDGLDPNGAGMPYPLQQIGSTRELGMFVQIPVITERDKGGSVELLHMPDDLSKHPTQAIADRENASAVIL